MKLIEGRKCEICGNDAKNFFFGAFVCESEDCINKAFDQCGGPGGHRLDKDEVSGE